jgi:hypothetical protein
VSGVSGPHFGDDRLSASRTLRWVLLTMLVVESNFLLNVVPNLRSGSTVAKFHDRTETSGNEEDIKFNDSQIKQLVGGESGD